MEKHKKNGIIINGIFALLIVIASVVFLLSPYSSYITKTIASLLFLLCGVFNFFYCKKYFNENFNLKFALFMLAGLLFSALGDILLIDFFIAGAILFGIGHVFYFVSFCFLKKFKWYDLISGAVIFIGVFMLIQFYPQFVFDGMKPLVLVYAFIISLMLGKAVGNVYTQKDKWLNIYVLTGAFLFFFSDAMLLFFKFGGRQIEYDIWCVITYYLAQAILSCSIFSHVFLKNDKN